jgi:hypothetical protein
MQPHLSLLALISWATGNNYLGLNVPKLSSGSFKVLDLTLKYLIQLELSFVQGEKWGG